MLGLGVEHNPESYELILLKEAETSHHIQEWGEMKVRSIMCCVEDTKN